jgi:integrase
MKLIDVIDAYVSLQWSLGKRFESAHRLLRQFARAMGDVRMHDIRAQNLAEFLRGAGPLSATRAFNHSVLSGLYRLAIARGYVSASSLPTSVPKLPPQQTPYVYSTNELRRLVDTAPILHVGHSRLQAPMYRTLILMLYGSGLRIGEALGLTLRDVDIVERVITVRKTKFFKTRLVPIGQKLAQELAAHMERVGSCRCRRARTQRCSQRARGRHGPTNTSSRCFSGSAARLHRLQAYTLVSTMRRLPKSRPTLSPSTPKRLEARRAKAKPTGTHKTVSGNN